MRREMALFVSRHAFESGRSPRGFSRNVTGLLRDFAARGYRLFLVTDRLALGDVAFESPLEMLAHVRDSERHVLPVSDVILLDNGFDPGPFWDAARRYNLALHNSIFVSVAGELFSAARNAGVLRSQPSDEMFGLAA